MNYLHQCQLESPWPSSLFFASFWIPLDVIITSYVLQMMYILNVGIPPPVPLIPCYTRLKPD